MCIRDRIYTVFRLWSKFHIFYFFTIFNLSFLPPAPLFWDDENMDTLTKFDENRLTRTNVVVRTDKRSSQTENIFMESLVQ